MTITDILIISLINALFFTLGILSHKHLKHASNAIVAQLNTITDKLVSKKIKLFPKYEPKDPAQVLNEQLDEHFKKSK